MLEELLALAQGVAPAPMLVTEQEPLLWILVSVPTCQGQLFTQQLCPSVTASVMMGWISYSLS